LHRTFRDDVTIGALLLGIAEESERESQISEPPPVAASDRFGGVERMVLPCTIRVCAAENLFRPFQLLGALNEGDRGSSACVEPTPEGLVLGDFVFGEPICFIDQTCVSHAKRPVPEIRHAIVTKSVDVIDLEPVMVDGKKIIACQLAIEVG